MQYRVSVASGTVTVELGLRRQKSSCRTSFTLLDSRTMAATRAHTLTPWGGRDPETRGTVKTRRIRQAVKRPPAGRAPSAGGLNGAQTSQSDIRETTGTFLFGPWIPLF